METRRIVDGLRELTGWLETADCAIPKRDEFAECLQAVISTAERGFPLPSTRLKIAREIAALMDGDLCANDVLQIIGRHWPSGSINSPSEADYDAGAKTLAKILRDNSGGSFQAISNECRHALRKWFAGLRCKPDESINAGASNAEPIGRDSWSGSIAGQVADHLQPFVAETIKAAVDAVFMTPIKASSFSASIATAEGATPNDPVASARKASRVAWMNAKKVYDYLASRGPDVNSTVWKAEEVARQTGLSLDELANAIDYFSIDMPDHAYSVRVGAIDTIIHFPESFEFEPDKILGRPVVENSDVASIASNVLESNVITADAVANAAIGPHDELETRWLEWIRSQHEGRVSARYACVSLGVTMDELYAMAIATGRTSLDRDIAAPVIVWTEHPDGQHARAIEMVWPQWSPGHDRPFEKLLKFLRRESPRWNGGTIAADAVAAELYIAVDDIAEHCGATYENKGQLFDWRDLAGQRGVFKFGDKTFCFAFPLDWKPTR